MYLIVHKITPVNIYFPSTVNKKRGENVYEANYITNNFAVIGLGTSLHQRLHAHHALPTCWALRPPALRPALTRHDEARTVALPRLARVAVARGAAVVVQPILGQDVQDVQGSRGCDEISLPCEEENEEEGERG